jgi:hypothetical protein
MDKNAAIDIVQRFRVFEPIEAIALTTDEWEQGDRAIIEFAKSGEVIDI